MPPSTYFFKKDDNFFNRLKVIQAFFHIIIEVLSLHTLMSSHVVIHLGNIEGKYKSTCCFNNIILN